MSKKILWSSPIYGFRVPDPAHPKSKNLMEIVFDVTRSAPHFSAPSLPMKKVFRKIMHDYLHKKARILDFGAGKLRNSLYLLERGFKVCGVEFQKLSERGQGKKRYERATKFAKFWTLVYPQDFVADASRFDFVLLVNVLNVMPVPGERLLVLQHSYKKLRPGGYLLWYSQYGDADYNRRCTDDVRFGDGYYIGKKAYYKTFYREFSASEIDELALANGFEFVKSFPVPHNHVRLYRRAEGNPVSAPLTLSALEKQVPRDTSIQKPKHVSPRLVKPGASAPEILPNPEIFGLDSTLITNLESMPLGNKHAARYQNLVKAIFERIFVPERLRRPEKEVEIQERTERVDILFRCGSQGFFASLKPEYDVQSPYVFVECKNYSTDLKNPELQQMKSRLTTPAGRFGIIACRRLRDRARVLKRCMIARRDENKYIVVLEDNDLIQLLRFRTSDAFDAVDEFLDLRLRELLV